jgi:hypothetical protein
MSETVLGVITDCQIAEAAGSLCGPRGSATLASHSSARGADNCTGCWHRAGGGGERRPTCLPMPEEDAESPSAVRPSGVLLPVIGTRNARERLSYDSLPLANLALREFVVTHRNCMNRSAVDLVRITKLGHIARAADTMSVSA